MPDHNYLTLFNNWKQFSLHLPPCFEEINLELRNIPDIFEVICLLGSSADISLKQSKFRTNTSIQYCWMTMVLAREQALQYYG